MNKLLNRSLKKFITYSALVLIGSIPVYYFILSRLWKYELNEHHITLSAKAGREDSFLIIASVTSLTVLFFILLMIGSILLNRRISRRLWQPFYRSLEQIRNFDLNQQKKIEFNQTDIEEFSELNQRLDKLIAGNIAAYSQQKEFADNASHELQTPLAIIQSKMDLLLQSQHLTEEQYHIIEDANKALARVTRINKNLLLLTKIENSHFREKEKIDLSGLLGDSVNTFSHIAEGKQLEMQADILPDVIVEGNRILVEIVLNNLMTNAIRHSASPGKISVHLTNKELSVMNSGTSALKEEQLFKRFGRSSVELPGTGLGLALVKQICNRNDWRIYYKFDNNRHIFNLDFLPNRAVTMH